MTKENNLVSYVEDLRKSLNEIENKKDEVKYYENQVFDASDVDFETDDDYEENLNRAELDLSQAENALDYSISNLKETFSKNNFKDLEKLVSYAEKTFNNIIN